MNNRRVHPESAVVLKVAPQALRRSASNGEEGSAAHAHDGVQEEGFIAGTCAALGQSLCKPKDAAFEVKLARWELFEAVDVDESNLIGINELSAFLKSFVEQLSQESVRSELELRALALLKVLVAGGVNNDSVDAAMEMDFTQFCNLIDRWAARPEGVDIAVAFSLYARRRRYPRGCTALCQPCGVVRRKKLVSDMTYWTAGSQGGATRKDLLSAALSVYAELTGFVDLFSDFLLLAAVMSGGEKCEQDQKRYLMCSAAGAPPVLNTGQNCTQILGAMQPGCGYSQSYTLVNIVLTFSIIAPYLIAFSSGVHYHLGRGMFDSHRLASKPLWQRALTGLYATCLGPLYFLFIDVCMLLQAATWDLYALFIDADTFHRRQASIDAFYDALGMDHMAVEGYRRQRTIAQLLFESIPQVILQGLVFLEVFHVGDLLVESRGTILLSLVISFVNVISQFGKIWVEASGLRENFVRYSMTCMLARLGFVPFLDELVRQAKLAAQSEEENNTAPNAAPNGAQEDDTSMVVPHQSATHWAVIEEEKVLNFDRVICPVPLVTAWTGIRMDFNFQFSPNSIATVINRMALVPAAAYNSSRRLRRVKLGNSCRNCDVHEIVQLIRACHRKISLDPHDSYGVDWESAVENAKNRTRLTFLDPSDHDSKWDAWLADGTPLVKLCLATEEPKKVAGGQNHEEQINKSLHVHETGYLFNVAIQLLNNGASPNAVDGAGEPLLHFCVRTERVHGAKLLLEHGAFADKSMITSYYDLDDVSDDDVGKDAGHALTEEERDEVGEEQEEEEEEEEEEDDVEDDDEEKGRVAMVQNNDEAPPLRALSSQELRQMSSRRVRKLSTTYEVDSVTPLCTAIDNSNLALVELLLDRNHNQHAADPNKLALRAGQQFKARKVLRNPTLRQLIMLNSAASGRADADNEMYARETGMETPLAHALRALAATQENAGAAVDAHRIMLALMGAGAKLLDSECGQACEAVLSLIMVQGANFLHDVRRCGPLELQDWAADDGTTIMQMAARGICGFRVCSPEYWDVLRSRFLAEFDGGKEEVRKAVLLHATQTRTQAVSTTPVLHDIISHLKICHNEDCESILRNGSHTFMAFVRELDPETASSDATKREIASACIRLARAGEKNATNALLALLATLGADGAADLAFEKAVSDSESATFAAMEAIDPLVAACTKMEALRLQLASKQAEDEQRVLQQTSTEELKEMNGDFIAPLAHAAPQIVENSSVPAFTSSSDDVLVLRRAFNKVSMPLVKDADERVKLVVKLLTLGLELVAAADLYTDIVILLKMYRHDHMAWATATVVMMVSPYLVCYGALLSLLLRSRVLEPVTAAGKQQPYAAVRKTIGLLFLSPLCIIYFVLVDVVYNIKAITVDLCIMVLQVLSAGHFAFGQGGDSWVSRVVKSTLGLTHMDIEGYRRLRTLSQLIFESFPQIVLQTRIVLAPAMAAEIGLTDGELFSSMGFAIFHLLVTVWVLNAEAHACQASGLHYFITCLSGRFGWVPFTERFRGGQLTTNESVQPRAGQKYGFGTMSTKLRIGGRFKLEYEFASATVDKLIEALAHFDREPIVANRICIELGNTVSLITLDDIIRIHSALTGRVNLRMGAVNWDALIRNSSLEWRDDDSGKLEPAGKRALGLLSRFLSFENVDAVCALLQAGIRPTGVTADGKLFLTAATELESPRLCELMLDSMCTLADNRFSKVKANFNGVFESTLKLPLEEAVRLGNLSVLEVFSTHPRIRINAFKRKELLREALQAFENADRSASEDHVAQHMARGARLVFCAGGRFASDSPDVIALSNNCAGGSQNDTRSVAGTASDIHAMAIKRQVRSCLKWLHDVAQCCAPTMRVHFADRSSMVVKAADLERFMLLRDKLSVAGRRWPVGHPQNLRSSSPFLRYGFENDSSAGPNLQAVWLQSFADIRREPLKHLIELATGRPALCPAGGHILRLTKTSAASLRCDVCGDVPQGTTVQECHLCDYRMCIKCSPVRCVAQSELVPQMDCLVDGLGLDRGVGNYIAATASLREVAHVSVQQSGQLVMHANEPDRARCVVHLTLPADCWRVKSLRIAGIWEDQGWGGTGANRVECHAHTSFCGSMRKMVHQVDRNVQDKYPKCELSWAVDAGTPSATGSTFLEVLSAGDEIEIILTCVAWGGWQSKARDTSVDVVYFRKGALLSSNAM